MWVCGVMDSMEVLTSWVKSGDVNNVIPFLPQGCKTPKGRYVVLRWLSQYRQQCAPSSLIGITDCILDGVLDKEKNTRIVAMNLFEVMLEQGGAEKIMAQAQQRKHADVLQIRSIIDAFASPPSAEKSEPSVANEAEAVSEPSKDEFQQRREALSKRSGARVLGKPKLGPDGKPIPKYNVKSSIPKPIPRKTFEATRNAVSQSYLSRYEGGGVNELRGGGVSEMRGGVSELRGNNVNELKDTDDTKQEYPTEAEHAFESRATIQASIGVEPAAEEREPFREEDAMTHATLNSNGNASEMTEPEADRVVFGAPVSREQLFLPLSVSQTPLDATPSSLLVEHWITSLKSLAAALLTHSSLLQHHMTSVEEQGQTLFVVLVPQSGDKPSETVTEEDRSALRSRANEWVMLCTVVLQTVVREGLCEECVTLFTVLLNLLMAPFSSQSSLPEVGSGVCGYV